MNPLSAMCPAPPDWRPDWPALVLALPWLQAMADCPQDPVFHAEGDVLTHTGMVLDALVTAPAWRALPAPDREDLFAAALLHDVAKPAVTRREPDGRITSRGHSRRGAAEARRVLWEMGWAPARRERICAMIVHHQEPFYVLERDDAQRRVITMSWRLKCRQLALLAEADAHGRRCADRERILERVEMFREYAADLDCLDRPWAFASDHSRFLYFRREDRDPRYHAHDDTRGRLTVLSGLPAAGKDTWLKAQPAAGAVVSLDALRAEMGVAPDGEQGPVAAVARERAREHLRRGEDLVWNATNISRDHRRRVIDLGADYDYRIRIVHLETAPDALHHRNAARARPVPAAAVGRMLRRWEPPDPTEAHEVLHILT